MNPIVETLLLLTFLAVILWRSREMLRFVLPIVTNPRRLADFGRFFWRGREKWFRKAPSQSAGTGSEIVEETEEKRGSQWVELARALGGYALAFMGAGLYVNDGGSKVLGVIFMAVATVLIPSKWYM